METRKDSRDDINPSYFLVHDLMCYFIGGNLVMRSSLQLIWVIAFLIVITACAPKITSFQASPRRLCEGQNTVVSWEVEGHALLSSEPVMDGTGPVPSSGSMNYALFEPTLFKIIVMRGGKDAFAEQEVAVFASGDTKTIVIETYPDSTQGLVAKETLSPQVWDDMMRIDSISGQSGRALNITHEGRKITLPADGSPSDLMRGAKMSGLWEIRANLLSGEVMGDPTHAPPDRLRILVSLTCVTQGGTM